MDALRLIAAHTGWRDDATRLAVEDALAVAGAESEIISEVDALRARLAETEAALAAARESSQ
jgi:hypothetical protein